MIYLFFTLLCIITAGLTLKLYLLQKGIKEIDSCLAEILSKDTNGQIVLSSRSRHICRLASRLNSQLKQLREKQLKYNSGDKELKEAVTNISHDLRTPLTAINGFLELLEGEVHFLKTFYAPKAETDSPESAQCFETETDSTENAQCFESVTHSTETEHPSARVQLEPKIYIHIQEMQHCLDVLRNRAGHMKQLTDELFRYSLDGIVAFSSTPLYISSILGAGMCGIAVMAILFIIVRQLLFGGSAYGWPSMACIVILIGGLQLLCVGILGLYLSKAYLEVKHRPIYIAREISGADANEKELPS